LKLGFGERVVLCVGRLSHEKGQSYLLRAARAWPESVRVVIAGVGPDRHALQRIAHEERIAHRVSFTGLVDDVAPYYALADVVVLPSLSEGSPNVLLEAMACGVPVVATNVGGIPEIALDGVNALLGPPGDPGFIAGAAGLLLTQPDLARRIGSAGRAAVIRRHQPEHRTETLSRLYAALTGGVGTQPSWSFGS
jgi:glycosyltransferase involved in cell wall biosynthesis